MRMQRSDLRTASVTLALTFTVGITITGFEFLTNQYVFFRFSEDANLPYEVNERASGCGPKPHSDNGSHNDARNMVQAKTARLLALSTIISLVFGLFSSVMMGIMSDRYGRPLTIAVVLLGQALRFTIIAMMVLFHLPVVVALFVACIFSGLVGGGWIALLVQISVVFTDITRIADRDEDSVDNHVIDSQRGTLERRRLILLGIFDAVGTLASAIGTAVIGSTIVHFGFVPSVLGLLTIFTIPVVLIRFVPETKRSLTSVIDPPVDETSPLLPVAVRVKVDPDVVVDTLGKNWRNKLITARKILRTHHPATIIILAAVFLFSLTIFTEGQFLFLYLMSTPFCWSPEDVGLYNGLNSLALAGTSLLLILITAWTMRTSPIVPVLMRPLTESSTAILRSSHSSQDSLSSNPPNRNPVAQLVRRGILLSQLRMLVYVGIGFFMITTSKLIMGFAFKLTPPACSQVAFVALFAGLLRAAVIPTLKSFLSSLHPADAQGRLFSLFGLSEYLGLILGQPSLPVIYANTVFIFPGAVFLLSAGLSTIALLLILILLYAVVRDLSSINSVSNINISPIVS